MKHINLKYILFSLVLLNINLVSLVVKAAEPEEPFSSSRLFCSNPLSQSNIYTEPNGFSLIGSNEAKWLNGTTLTYSIDMLGVTVADFSAKKLPNGDVTKGICNVTDLISVCQLKLQNYIKPYAEVWSQYGNIKFPDYNGFC